MKLLSSHKHSSVAAVSCLPNVAFSNTCWCSGSLCSEGGQKLLPSMSTLSRSDNLTSPGDSGMELQMTSVAVQEPVITLKHC
jgi:hypothetical protein